MIEKSEQQLNQERASGQKANLRVVSDRVAQSYASVLKTSRIKQNLSIRDAATALHISSTVIEALEEKRYEKLPADIYTCGYIRSYAALLGLNPEGLIKDFRQDKEQRELMEAKRFEQQCQQQQSSETARIGFVPFMQRRLARLVKVFSATSSSVKVFLVFLTLVAAVVLQQYGSVEEMRFSSIDKVRVLGADGSVLESRLSDSEQVVLDQGNISASGQLVTEDSLRLSFHGASWITLRDFENSLVHQSRRQKGDVLELTGVAPFYLKLSNGNVVEAFFNGQQVNFSDQLSVDGQLHEFELLPAKEQ